MTANSIDIKVEFSFKGEMYSPSSTIDFDKLFEYGREIPPLHLIIAQQNSIDTYSYLFEVMQESAIVFENPAGCVADYLYDGMLDIERLADRIHKEKMFVALQEIARRTLGIERLDNHPDIKHALSEAYELGKSR